VRCPYRFSVLLKGHFFFCCLVFPQTGFLVRALCPVCQIEAWNVTTVTSHSPVEYIWCLKGKRLNCANILCIVTQHPGKTHLLQFCQLWLSECLLTRVLIPKPVFKYPNMKQYPIGYFLTRELLRIKLPITSFEPLELVTN